ncbi:ribosome-associated translation inhibitor RaiA [Candidatus Saccharibacteria bacterium]|nr:ribosome-associated translation inhibitor RaiA [Candidatus Saccharibacteria bacterium]
MIRIQLTGRQFEIDSELEKYINRKLGRLDKYLPKGSQNQGMSVEILRDPSGKEDNRYRIVSVLRVQGPDIVAETATINPHSAVDIIEQKLRIQIRKYKEKHQPQKLRLKDMFDKFKSH